MSATDSEKSTTGTINPEIPVWLKNQFNVYFTTPCYIFCDNEIHFEVTLEICSCGRKKYRMFHGTQEQITLCPNCLS